MFDAHLPAYPMVKQARAMIAAINWVRLEK
jgi:hypothetical protein